jgi:YgiT-type zinc finger domain-containing protein
MRSAQPKPLSCPQCQGTTFTTKTTTYPMRMPDGRQVNVGRVAVQECAHCHHLIPTKAGSDKISRSMAAVAQLFFGS